MIRSRMTKAEIARFLPKADPAQIEAAIAKLDELVQAVRSLSRSGLNSLHCEMADTLETAGLELARNASGYRLIDPAGPTGIAVVCVDPPKRTAKKKPAKGE